MGIRFSDPIGSVTSPEIITKF
ncbi:hypothetical protein MXB_5537 [Myxobolus squamalis]|nr:hypothetical protein MXB_5537 [Myxobolus squamalis]